MAQTTKGLAYQQRLIERLVDKYANIDWIWDGDGEWDERRLVATLNYTEENKKNKLAFIRKMIVAEGYGS